MVLLLKLLVADFETDPFDFESDHDYKIEPRFICFKDITTQERTYINLEQDTNELFDFLSKIGNRRIGARIWFHNLKFDLAFLFDYISRQENYEIVKNGGNIIQFKTYRIVKEKNGKVKHRTILDLRNSLTIFPTSLKELGKSLGFEKMETDYYSDIITEQYIEYCFRDCEVIERGLQELCERYKDLYDYDLTIDKIPLTISALNKRVFHALGMRRHGKQFFDLIYDRYAKDYENRMRRYYFGGRVEVFNFNECLNGNYNDFNSLYPAQMLYKEFPLAPYKRYVCSSQDKCWSDWKTNKNIFGCEVVLNEQLDIPMVPIRLENGKILFPKGKKTCFLFREEIEYLQELNQEMCLIAVWTCSGYDTIFDDYVFPAYELKRTSTGFRKTHAKLCLNGLYGKFAEKREKETILLVNTEGMTEKELREIEPIERSDGSIINIKRITKTHDFLKINIFYAMLITARARLQLHKAICQSKKTYYCDTDSLVNNETSYEYSDDIGSLKPEFTFTKYQALGCKEYAYELFDEKEQKIVCKFKMKGFGKLQSYDSINQFKDKYFEGKKQHRQVGFLESFNRKMDLNQMLVFDKFKQSTYDKRWILSDFTTKAFDVDNDDFKELCENNDKMIRLIISKDLNR